MKFGDNLKTLRKKAGFTQTELANKLSVSQSVVAHYEKNQKKPDLDKLPIIAQILNVTVNELFSTNETKQIEEAIRPHGNSREVQMTEAFKKLKPEEQRALLKQAKGMAKD